MAFDIDKFAETSEPVGWRDLDFSAFRTDPLPQETLRTLRYMADVEYHTVCYLRDLLVTPSHNDSEVSTFMTMWNREEFWHGEALAAVLKEHGVTLEYDQLKAKRIKLGWRDRLGPIKQAFGSSILGKDFIATHMSWGAANEWSAVAAYRRMAAMETHPALSPLLKRIAQQETRHVAFYATQARARLAQSPKAQKVTRLAFAKFWGPVGSGVMAESEVDHAMRTLFSGEEGKVAIDKLDRNVAALPGMEGLTIFADALGRRGIGVAA